MEKSSERRSGTRNRSSVQAREQGREQGIPTLQISFPPGLSKGVPQPQAQPSG